MTRLDKQMDATGSFPKEMERTIALHYSVFALQAFYGSYYGRNYWHGYMAANHAINKSLQKGLLFQKPYITNQKPWMSQQIKPYEVENFLY